MKKIIISILTLVIGVSLSSAVAFADASFNSGGGVLPTITVSNVTTNPCGYGSGIGCWSTSASAKPGDIIAAQVSVANTSNETAKNVTISLQPSRNGATVSFFGGGAATNANKTTGSATVNLSQATTITTLLGDQRPDWRTNKDSTPREVNTSALFGNSGFSVGDVPAGTQVVLTVRFRVDGSAPVNTCSINSFTANPTSIVKGNSSALSWSTTNCDYVNVTSVGTNLSANSGSSVSPTVTTTYTLTAFPNGGSKSVTVTVTNPVVNQCAINSFTASPTSITQGNSSTLNWNTTNCDYVNITSVANNLPVDGSHAVSPATTTTYTLSAFPNGGSKSVTVTVNNNPTNECAINTFTASPTSIQSGNSSILNWGTTNCDHVTITSFTGTLAGNGSQSVYPTSTTTYTLTAFPGGKTATATVTVTNGPANNCTVNSFNASPSSITRGNSSVLSWDTSNCSYVTINPIAGNLPVDGSGSVTPANSTTYTLTAYPGGVTATTSVNVYGNNNNYCSINTFYVDSNSINQGQTTTLHWSTTGANSVYITGFGSQNSSGSLSISPYSSMTYTLTLNGTNCNGNTSQSVYVTVNQGNYNNGGNYQQPQAITTVASVLSSYSAQLNGIAVPNTSYGSASAWFEYGSSTALGNRTDSQNVNGYGTYPYSANISGLAPGGTYYYRAVVQTQGGLAYGSVVPFSIPSASVYVPPTKTVYVQSQTTSHSSGVSVTGNSKPSLFKLEVVSSADHMCIGGNISYTVNYQNISTQMLQNSVLQITFPGEVTYVSSSQGSYDVTTRTLTVPLGDVQPGQMGSVTANAQVNDQATVGKIEVITATMVYTNPITRAQEQAIAYSLITVSNDCPSVLGASVFGFGGFLPTTLLGWLLLILIILALIVLARSLYRHKEEQAK